jgi:hypothetical protein
LALVTSKLAFPFLTAVPGIASTPVRVTGAGFCPGA